MKSIYLILVLVLIGVLALAGCQASTVAIDGIPQRIISLSPSNTEIAFALGLDNQIIGVTTYDNYPPAALSKPQVSEYSSVDVEKIVSLQPDLVLADSIQKNDAVPALEKLGVKVLVLSPDTIDGIYRDIELVGQVTGKTPEANALVASLQKRVSAVTSLTAQSAGTSSPRVLYVTWHDPIWTAGGNTIINDLIDMAGGTNIAADLDGYITITLEQVIERNPQIILVMTSMGDQDTSLNYIKTEPRLQATDALKNNQLYLVDADIFGRTTPRIVDGLEQLAKIIHPELFK
jgi:cobalamin transport system substrate-binding protein